MLSKTFTVKHKDPEAAGLGIGIVVGDLISKTLYQYETSIQKPGRPAIKALCTEETAQLFYQVLWANAKENGVSVHPSSD